MRTFMAKTETVKRDWFLVDASGQTLGRLASEIAHRLRGKHKPEFTPHMDAGDYIVVINVEKMRVTGNKYDEKTYYHHSSYPGGIKARTYKEMLKRAPHRILELAVKGMLPKNPLGRAVFRKLKVYAGTEHPHSAQQPHILSLTENDNATN